MNAKDAANFMANLVEDEEFKQLFLIFREELSSFCALERNREEVK